MTDTPILHKRDIDGMEELERIHPFNDKAVIYMKSLGNVSGLTSLGAHLVRIAPGDETTACHNHELSDEFVYILSGAATLTLGEEEHELGTGDFAGFPANGPPHLMKNTGNEDLVYIMAGGRPRVDIVNYPHAGMKMYKVGERLDIVETQDVKVVIRGEQGSEK
ncbi:MAG: cupin domain-containing protein [Gammaproteobacteria bacterium]|jgi:uncharacterized cupin superfamily protein